MRIERTVTSAHDAGIHCIVKLRKKPQQVFVVQGNHILSNYLKRLRRF